MSDAPAATAAALLKILRDDEALRCRGVTLAVDALLEAPLERLWDRDAVRDALEGALSLASLQRAHDRHVLPALRRELERGEGEVLGDFAPEPLRRRFEEILAQSKPKARWALNAVDADTLRKLLGPVVQQTLVSFASKLPLPGVGADGGGRLGQMAGRLGRSAAKRAERLADVGRSVLGGLGAELERTVQNAARDFSQTAMGEFQSAFEARLASEEGQALLAQLRHHAIETAARESLRAVYEDSQTLPLEALLALLPELLAHNVARETVHERIDAELSATLEVLGAMTPRALLEEAEIYAGTRQSMIARADAEAARVAATDAFGDWLADWVTAASSPDSSDPST